MKKASTALASAILLNPVVLQAQDSDAQSLRFNGFGTAGVVYSDEDQADSSPTCSPRTAPGIPAA